MCFATNQLGEGLGTRDGLVVGSCCSGDVVLAVLAMDGGRAASSDQCRAAVGQAIKATFETEKTLALVTVLSADMTILPTPDPRVCCFGLKEILTIL